MFSGRLPAVAVALAIVSSLACSPSGGYRITPVPADQTLEERVVLREGGIFTDKIAFIDIQGTIEDDIETGLLGPTGENPVALLTEKLERAAHDPRVKAVILRINSPGGTVTASDIMYQEILHFRTTTKKPVIALFLDVAASGAYYAACAADQIVAERTTITGSIGVIMQTVSFAGTLDKIGVKTDAITSGPMKDAGSPLRDMTSRERAYFQAIIDNLYARFIEVVQTRRPAIPTDKLHGIADGRVYTAPQALENGLIDRIGTLRDAFAIAKEKSGLKQANGVMYARPLHWKGSVYAEAPPLVPAKGGLTVNLLNINGPRGWTNTPRFLYLWSLE